MRAAECLRETNCRLQNTLRSCVSLFREGKDNLGLDALVGSVEDLECILDILQCTGETDFEPGGTLHACRRLLDCMKNRDVTGVTDVLEFTIIPLSELWAARCDTICR